MTEQQELPDGRRSDVLDAALRTFARFGYRKTSMDDVAAAARISRPGLYYLFASKPDLFREATERSVSLDLAAAERALADAAAPLGESILEAFDCWAGRYVGPLRDTAMLLEESPNLVGANARSAPARFEALLVSAIERSKRSAEARDVARTLVSLSIGVKHQSVDRAEYRARMGAAIPLLDLE